MAAQLRYITRQEANVVSRKLLNNVRVGNIGFLWLVPHFVERRVYADVSEMLHWHVNGPSIESLEVRAIPSPPLIKKNDYARFQRSLAAQFPANTQQPDGKSTRSRIISSEEEAALARRLHEGSHGDIEDFSWSPPLDEAVVLARWIGDAIQRRICAFLEEDLGSPPPSPQPADFDQNGW